MPRVEPWTLSTSTYMYTSRWFAESGTGRGGCGVLLGVPAINWPGAIHLYGVTNAHVVENGGSVVRATRESGQPWVFDLATDDWIMHSSGEDVALALLRTVPLQPGEAGLTTSSTFRWVPVESLVEEEDLGYFMSPGRPHPWNVGPVRAGEEIFSISRFIGFDGVERNEPIVRFGNLAAQRPISVPQRPGRDRDQNSLLVEARSLGGCSGAPVFLHRTVIINPDAVRQWGYTEMPVHEPLLLGIGWGHIKHPVDESLEFQVELEKPNQPTPGRYNSGVMAVVPAWHLAELLEDDRVVSLRNAAEAEGTEAGGGFAALVG